jgi:hypothetical protein
MEETDCALSMKLLRKFYLGSAYFRTSQKHYSNSGYGRKLMMISVITFTGGGQASWVTLVRAHMP